MEVQLTADQNQAMLMVERWLKNPKDKQFVLAGLAGSGKSFLVSYISNKYQNKYNFKFMAPTGKASEVLRKRGVPCNTIHSQIYEVFEENGVYHFEKKGFVYGDIWIIDEASMVSTDIYNDLLTYNRKIIFVGDIGQLPPVGKDPRIMSNPNIILKKIVRQAEGNAIISVAHAVYNHQPVPMGNSNNQIWVVPMSQIRPDLYLRASQVLVYTNKKRKEINDYCRAQLGYKEQIPQDGDKLIVTKNTQKMIGNTALMNGTVGFCRGVRWLNSKTILLKFQPESEDIAEYVKVDVRPFFNIIPEKFSRDCVQIDYAYALTVHKAQGSQWENIVVVEDVKPISDESRWLYTAITRAEKKCVVFIAPR